jgi:hypothetical protein
MDAKLVIAINHSIVRILQVVKIFYNLNFVSFSLLVKLKCDRDHVHGLN